jgi:cephalosporin hydroxylase
MSSYLKNLAKPSDIQEHLGLMHGLAWSCRRVVELGFRTGVSTSAFLAAGAKVRSYDSDPFCRPFVQKLAKEYPKTFEWKLGDSRDVDIPACDLLLIDTDHTYETTLIELCRHQHMVSTWIVLHDTVKFGLKDRPPGKGPGVMTAIHYFLMASEQHSWKQWLHLNNCNGLTLLKRVD